MSRIANGRTRVIDSPPCVWQSLLLAENVGQTLHSVGTPRNSFPFVDSGEYPGIVCTLTRTTVVRIFRESGVARREIIIFMRTLKKGTHASFFSHQAHTHSQKVPN